MVQRGVGAAGPEVSCCSLVLRPLARNCFLECALCCLETGILSFLSILCLLYLVLGKPAAPSAGSGDAKGSPHVMMPLRSVTVARTDPGGTVWCHHRLSHVAGFYYILWLPQRLTMVIFRALYLDVLILVVRRWSLSLRVWNFSWELETILFRRVVLRFLYPWIFWC